MGVPTLLREDDLEPVDDGLTINFSSSVDDGPSELAPCFGSREISLEEHAHIGDQEVDRLVDMHGVNAGVFRGDCLKKIHLSIGGQGSVNRLCRWYVEGSADLM